MRMTMMEIGWLGGTSFTGDGENRHDEDDGSSRKMMMDQDGDDDCGEMVRTVNSWDSNIEQQPF